MPTIACLSPYDEERVKELAGTDDVKVVLAPRAPAPEAVRELVVDADIVISDARHRHRLDRETLAVMRNCRLIVQPAVGYDVVDHEAAAEFGIPVANAHGFNSESVADWVLMGILSVVGDAVRHDRAMRAGAWRMSGGRWRRHELGALTVGIVGMGNIGQAVARRIRAFGSRVVYTDAVPRDVPDAEETSLDELLAASDVITLHVPLNAETRGLIGAAELRRMRRGAVLVNACRGPIVDEAALIEALRSGHLGGAALDVFEEEPLAEDSPLRIMDNVLLSPHAAGGTVEAAQRALDMTGANIQRVLAGDEPLNVVNGVVRRR